MIESIKSQNRKLVIKNIIEVLALKNKCDKKLVDVSRVTFRGGNDYGVKFMILGTGMHDFKIITLLHNEQFITATY